MRPTDRLSICLLVVLIGLLLSTLPARASLPRALDVRAFGARGDDTTKDTGAFQKALDAVGQQAGGGILDVPPGIYLIGSIFLPAHVTLNVQAGATVLGSDDPADYPLTTGRRVGRMQAVRRALIAADHADGIALVGDGLIQGSRIVASERDPNGPALFEPVSCSGVRVTGLTVKNFGASVLHPTFCDGVSVSRVICDTVGSNSAGLALDSCQHVHIDGCTFSGDGISLESGTGTVEQVVGRPSEDMQIQGDTFLGGHSGIILGREVSGGIRGVRIGHCLFKGCGTALLIQSATGCGGFVEDIMADELTVSGGDVFIVNTFDTMDPDTPPVPGPAGGTLIRNIQLSNVRAKAKTLVDVAGSPQSPLDGLVLTHITGSCTQAITLRNATHVRLDHIFVKRSVGPRLITQNVSGTGLDDAVPYQVK